MADNEKKSIIEEMFPHRQEKKTKTKSNWIVIFIVVVIVGVCLLYLSDREMQKKRSQQPAPVNNATIVMPLKTMSNL